MPAPRSARRPAARVTRRPEPVDLSEYDEPDDGTEEAPTRRRQPLRRSQAPEEEAPTRRRHNQGAREDVVERLRGRTRPRPVEEDEDEEDERPRGRRGRGDDEPRGRGRDREAPPKVDTSGGFRKFRDERAKHGGFPDSFKPEEKETYLIKFLEDEPFSVYGQHWINEIKEGRRSFVCLGDDNNCPLCDDLGDDPRAMALFNMVVWQEVKKGRQVDLVPAFKVWECGPQIAGILAGLADELEAAGEGLASAYVTVRKTSTGSGRGKRVNWAVHPIKERDVEDDWGEYGAYPLSEEEIEEFETEMRDESMVKPDSRSDLRQVVKEVQKLQD